MKEYKATVYHSGSGAEKLCSTIPEIIANSYTMACAMAESLALNDSRTGVVTKIEVELVIEIKK